MIYILLWCLSKQTHNGQLRASMFWFSFCLSTDCGLSDRYGMLHLIISEQLCSFLCAIYLLITSGGCIFECALKLWSLLAQSASGQKCAFSSCSLWPVWVSAPPSPCCEETLHRISIKSQEERRHQSLPLHTRFTPTASTHARTTPRHHLTSASVNISFRSCQHEGASHSVPLYFGFVYQSAACAPSSHWAVGFWDE